MPIEFATSSKVPDDVAILGVPVCADDAESAAELLDLAFLAERGFDGKPGQTLAMPGNGGTTVVAVGVGHRDEITPETLRVAAAGLVRCAWTSTHVATLLLDALPDGVDRNLAAQAVAEGAALGAYRFTRYRSDPRPCTIERLTVVGAGGRRLATAVERGQRIAEAAGLARDLVNEPAGALTPRAFADLAAQIAEAKGLRYSILDEVDIEVAGLGGLLGVGRGSTEPARLVQLTYEPEKPRGTLALVGKGITFDSGGLSLKTVDGMATMKTDMSGAAAVLAAMAALPGLAPKPRVIAFIPTTENMPGGSAIKPGDVLKIRNGKTVEVLNTDAEGRLVLADGLSLATEEQPDAIIDIATLTGACQTALGLRIAGLMGNHDGLVGQVEAAAGRAGEDVWRLPLPADYRKYLDSDIADLRNVGAFKSGSFFRYGGALLAGLFLQEFVDGRPWAHLDIAGPARSIEDEGYLTYGASGFGTRTLIELVMAFKKP